MLPLYQASITGCRAVDEECACDERTVRQQCSRREMRAL
jgi:hypothetical protein